MHDRRLEPAVAGLPIELLPVPVAPDLVTAEEDGDQFDLVMMQCMLGKALAERDKFGGPLAKRAGIGGTALGVSLMLVLPGHPVLAREDYVQEDVCEEQEWIRDLLMRNVTRNEAMTPWFASIIARRAVEANHLWEDLGLPDRASLGRLLGRHFGALASRNTHGMRWKRFFYRALCEEEGYEHCTSPSCGACCDVEKCFVPESAEAIIARAKKGPA